MRWSLLWTMLICNTSKLVYVTPSLKGLTGPPLQSTTPTQTAASSPSHAMSHNTIPSTFTKVVPTSLIKASGSPLTCGLGQSHKELIPSEGFSVCNGNWSIASFCSADYPGYATLQDGHITPRKQYYPLHADSPHSNSGILLSLETYMNTAWCDYSSEPPKDPNDCGEGCDPWCVRILNNIMNDCKYRRQARCEYQSLR